MGIEDIENGDEIVIPTTRYNSMERMLKNAETFMAWVEVRYPEILKEYYKNREEKG
jgi:hypothetical protein